MDFEYKVGIIGGCGRVGLPLGLSFVRKGLKVLAIDINKEAVEKAVEATEGTTIGVMDNQGNIVKRSTR